MTSYQHPMQHTIIGEKSLWRQILSACMEEHIKTVHLVFNERNGNMVSSFFFFLWTFSDVSLDVHEKCSILPQVFSVIIHTACFGLVLVKAICAFLIPCMQGNQAAGTWLSFFLHHCCTYQLCYIHIVIQVISQSAVAIWWYSVPWIRDSLDSQQVNEKQISLKFFYTETTYFENSYKHLEANSLFKFSVGFCENFKKILPKRSMS